MSGYPAEAESAAGAILLAAGSILILLFISYLIPVIIISWRLMAKAGKPGWMAIIPVYNMVMTARISKTPEWIGWAAGILSIAPLGTDIMSALGSTTSSLPVPAAYLVSFATFSFSVLLLILSIIILVNYIQSYRHINNHSTVAFWICALLLPLAAIFMTKDIVYKHTQALASQPGAPSTSATTPPRDLQ
jgi:hypothetical protein